MDTTPTGIVSMKSTFVNKISAIKTNPNKCEIPDSNDLLENLEIMFKYSIAKKRRKSKKKCK